MANNKTIYNDLSLKATSPLLSIIADSGVASLLVQSAAGNPARVDFAGATLGHRLSGGAIGSSFSLLADNGSGLTSIMNATSAGAFTFGISGADLSHLMHSVLQITGRNVADHTPFRLVAGNTTGLLRAYMQNSDGSKYFEYDADFTANLVRLQVSLGSGSFTPLQFAANGTSQFNQSVDILTAGGPMLRVIDGGIFTTNADPYISFRDSVSEGGRVGYDSAVSNVLVLRNLLSGGGIRLSTNVGEALFLPDSTTGHDANFAAIHMTTFFVDAGIFIGRSATEYGYIGFNARTKSTPNSYDYHQGDTSSILQFNDGGFSFRGTGVVGSAGNPITFVDHMRLNKNGVLMIGTTTAATSTPYIEFLRGTAGHATGLGHIRLADITTDAVGKQTAISLRNAVNAEEDICIVYASGGTVYLGGGTSGLNAAAVLRFYTAPNEITTTGIEAMRISQTQDVYIGTTSNQGGHTSERLNIYKLQSSSGAGADSHANTANFLDLATLNAMSSSTPSSAAYFSLRRNLASQVADVTDTSAGGLSTIYAEARINTAPTFSYINTATVGVAALRVAGPVLAGGGTTAITNYFGIRVDGSSNATGTNKYGLFVDDQSGATNNWSIWTSNVGSVRFGNTVRVGNISGILSLDNEQVSVRRLLSVGNYAEGNIAGQFEYNANSNTATTGGATQAAIGGIYRRSITTSITDSASMNYSVLGGSHVFTVSSGQTYTNASQTFANFLVGPPSLSGGGSLAITTYAGVLVSSSSVNTGTNKIGVLIREQSGATNNWGLYQTGATQISRFEGGLGVGEYDAQGTGPNVFIVSRNQNALTRMLFRNTDAGASASVKVSLVGQPGDVNWTADSTAAGGVWSLIADSGYTGGRIEQAGNKFLALWTNGTTRLHITGSGMIRMRSDGGTGTYYFSGDEHVTNVFDVGNFNQDNTADFVRLNMVGDGLSSGKSICASTVQLSRTITTSTSDLSGWQVLTAAQYFSVASGQTYTNSTAHGISMIYAQFPGATVGTMAVTHMKAIWVQADSANTGTNKYGLLIEDISGSTNNYSIFTGIARSTFGGAIATRRMDYTSVATVAALPSSTSYVKVIGSTAMTIQGITAGIDGQILRIYNNSGQNMTIAHQNGTASANDRIVTMTGADVTTTGDGFVELIYDTGASRWILSYVTN